MDIAIRLLLPPHGYICAINPTSIARCESIEGVEKSRNKRSRSSDAGFLSGIFRSDAIQKDSKIRDPY
jgi:hypothetical protein